MRTKSEFFLLTLLLLTFSFKTQAECQGFYGFIRATTSVSDAAMSSFGSGSGFPATPTWSRENQVAITEAAPRGLVSFEKDPRSSWGIGQSRFGYCQELSKDLTGTLELDFIDFDKSLATVAIRPRIRVIGVEKAININNKIFVGQNWDIMSMVKPHTYNFVGLFFRSGNIGFQRPQIRYTHFNSGKEQFSLMVGAPGVNDGKSTDSSVERTVVPAIGARYFLVNNDKFSWGIAARALTVRHEDATGTDKKMRVSWVASTAGEIKVSPKWTSRFNIYTGTNVESAGSSLTLSTGSFTGNQNEVGGYITDRFTISDNLASQIGLGFASLFNNSEMREGQIHTNRHGEIALIWTDKNKMEYFAELAHFNTTYRWIGNELKDAQATQLEIGVVAKF